MSLVCSYQRSLPVLLTSALGTTGLERERVKISDVLGVIFHIHVHRLLKIMHLFQFESDICQPVTSERFKMLRVIKFISNNQTVTLKPPLSLKRVHTFVSFIWDKRIEIYLYLI